jgi:hypothetical protein
MKKFFLHLLLFVCLSVTLYLLLIFIATKIRDDKGFSVLDRYTHNAVVQGISTYWQFYEIEHQQAPVDVLIFGSSYAFRGFDTRVFEKYNLNAQIMATSSQPPRVTYFLMKEYLDKEPPKLIIYDVCLACNRSKGVEAFYDLSRNVPLSWMHVKMAMDIQDPFVYHSLASAWLSQLTHPMSADEMQPPSGHYYKGFISDYKNDPKLKIRSAQTLYKYDPVTPETIENIACIEAIAAYASQRHLNIIFTRQPSLFHYDPAQIARIIAIANKYNIPYVNLYQHAFWLDPGMDFYDVSHLNSRGAEKTTQKLIDDYLKPDPRYKKLWSHDL